jgi:glutamate-1-semialdehyde 2,1-aminomutase
MFEASAKLTARAHELIPGGCHTYAKGDDQYPELAPGFIARGLGSHVWDVDGNRYIEYGQGNRAVVLGHAFPEVIKAVRRELANGCNFVRPSPIEVECAERFLEMIEGAEMVKFCKDGSTATSGAVRLARAYTGRDLIACCADHPFFATYDWFIGTTPMSAGIPQAVKELTVTFKYDDVANVRQLFECHRGRIAALILEPAKNGDPQDGFLHEVKRLCHDNGALLIFDEMITGFRWHNGGGQKYYDVVPDLSCFGKALGNGFSVSALAGKRVIMRLGGIYHDQERVFLLSTTHGGETHALAAAIATMKVYQREPVIERLYRQGSRLAAGMNAAIGKHRLESYVEVLGKPCCLVFATRDQDRAPSQAFRSLFLQELIRGGVLAPSLVVGYGHTDEDIDRTVDAIDAALAVYRKALEDGVERFLKGRPSQTVFRRFNAEPQRLLA